MFVYSLQRQNYFILFITYLQQTHRNLQILFFKPRLKTFICNIYLFIIFWYLAGFVDTNDCYLMFNVHDIGNSYGWIRIKKNFLSSSVFFPAGILLFLFLL